MLICHCHRVSDSTITAHALEGANTVGRIGKCCKAGTECGGCVPAIRQIVEDTRDLLVAQRASFLPAADLSLPIAAE